MNKVKLELEKTGIYNPLRSGHYFLYILAEFLTTEMVGDGYNFFYNWMKNPNSTLTSGNIIGVKKIRNKVLMHLLFDSDLFYSDQKKYSLTISLDQLILVSEQWHELKKSEPPFIIITEDNGKYVIMASQE